MRVCVGRAQAVFETTRHQPRACTRSGAPCPYPPMLVRLQAYVQHRAVGKFSRPAMVRGTGALRRATVSRLLPDWTQQLLLSRDFLAMLHVSPGRNTHTLHIPHGRGMGGPSGRGAICYNPGHDSKRPSSAIDGAGQWPRWALFPGRLPMHCCTIALRFCKAAKSKVFHTRR